MRYYCRYCYSYNIFQFWNEYKREDWGLCRSCRKTAPIDTFYIDHDDGYWQNVDDRVREIINNRNS